MQKPIADTDGSPPVTVPEPTAPVLQPDAIGYTMRPFLVSLDWLTINMDCVPLRSAMPLVWEHLDPARWWSPIDPDRVYWTQPTEIRTAQFNRVTYVNDEQKRKVLTIWHEPHNNRLHSDTWMQVQFDNATLYTGEWSTLFRMLREAGCTLRGISKVDISCDGLEGAGGEFPAVVQESHYGRAKYYGKCDWLVRCSRGNVVGGEFGHRSSNKFIRAYRKKKEMKRKGVKEHIVHRWTEALGFNPMERPGEVNRFEVSLKGKEIRRYFPDERGPRAEEFLLGMTDAANRVDVFNSMAVDMFDFRQSGHKRAREAPSIVAWDWSRVVKAEPDKMFRLQRNHAITDHTIKVGLHAMFQMAVGMSCTDTMALAKMKAASHGPQWEAWFHEKCIAWTVEYGKLMKAGDPRTLEFFRSLALPDEGPELLTRGDWERKEQWEEMNRAMSGSSTPPVDPEPDVDPDEVNPW